MRGSIAAVLAAVGLSALLVGGIARAEPPAAAPAPAPAPEPPSPRVRALTWLRAHQNEDGSWGRAYSTAVTGLACLAFLASEDKPFDGERGHALTKGIGFLLRQPSDGVFPKQGHTWIHGQGFATLALSEAYGRQVRDGAKPDLDAGKLREVITKAVDAISRHQSVSGGWWYVPDSPHHHEGSTTVCAVQALVSAANHGFPIDESVLAKGFEYLKQCQNPDGGFDYKLGPGTVSMKEGTAGDVATLALMRRFDYTVMTNGVEFLKRTTPQAISAERFPYYGHFYACMGLTLFGEEMAAERDAKAYVAVAWEDVVSWQQEDGHFPLKGWMGGKTGDEAYGTAFAVLILGVPQKRLSVFHRRPEKLVGR